MAYYISKILITTALIVIISEIAKRNILIGGILASIPLISVLAILWLYVDTKDTQIISEFSINVFWLVIPSLAFFLTLPFLLYKGLNFYVSISMAIIVTIISYYLMIKALDKFRVSI